MPTNWRGQATLIDEMGTRSESTVHLQKRPGKRDWSGTFIAEDSTLQPGAYTLELADGASGDATISNVAMSAQKWGFQATGELQGSGAPPF